jgi:uncharacterized protein (TIRG00374 family)
MDSKLKKTIWFGVSTAIIAGLIYFADVNKFIEALNSASVPLLLPAFATGLSVFLVFGYTWHRFLTKGGVEVSYFDSVRLFLAGQFMNSITPLGQFGGEPFMAYIIRKNTGTSYEKAFSTVFSADIVNGIPMLTFVLGGALYLVLFNRMNDVVLQTFYAGIVLTALGGLIVYLLWFKAGIIESYILGLLRFFSNITGFGESLVNGAEERLERVQSSFETIGEDPRHLFETAVVAHLSFVLQVFCLFFILTALDVGVDFTPLYFIIAISGLANFAPTPGGSGAYEGTMASIISSPIFLGLNFEIALAAAVLFRLTTYWPGLVIGYLSFLSVEGGEK